jgi:hypothetical protein
MAEVNLRRSVPVAFEFIGNGNRWLRITALIPVERIEEFIDGPTPASGRPSESSGLRRTPQAPRCPCRS